MSQNSDSIYVERLCALGGKDSCYNMVQCVAQGHDIIALANLAPNNKDELDSYMYQTVGHHAIDLYARAMGLPLYRRVIQGKPLALDAQYTCTNGDEVEDLYELLNEVKEACGIKGVSVGAILSDYQRVRVEHVCARLQLTPLAYLWRRDQNELLQEMIASGLQAIVIKVAALGLEPKHLGKSLQEIYPHMVKMEQKYGLNICGEGGEYETFTLDCPLFQQAIVIDTQCVVVHSADAFAPVAYLNLLEMHCQQKPVEVNTPITTHTNPNERLLSELDLTESDLNVSPTHHHVSQYNITEIEDLDEPDVSTNEDGEFWISGVKGLFTEDSTSITDAVESAFNSLQSIVTCRCQAKMADIVSVKLYIQDMAAFSHIDSLYRQHFTTSPPVRLCVGAYLPSHTCVRVDVYGHTHSPKHTRRSMHVTSVSHWAPAVIGHYSQAVQINTKIHVSGQIALCPPTNAIISGGIIAETRLSLRHVTRILTAMHPGTCLRHCTQVTCYVVRENDISIVDKEWSRAVLLEVWCTDNFGRLCVLGHEDSC